MGNIEKFDSIANQYDTNDRITTANLISDTIRTYIVDGTSKKAIDYGCGTGLIGLNLLDSFQSVLFMDASTNMIKQVQQKIETSNIQNADTLCCDLMEEMPKNLHADYIIMTQVLLHIKDIEPMLLRLYNLLNDGGHLLIVDFDKNDAIHSSEVHNGFEQQELIYIVKQIGFTTAESKTFYHGSKLFMNQDASLFILDAIKGR